MRLLALMVALCPVLASADEITVLSGGAARAFVERMARSLSAHRVKLEWQPMGKLTQSLAAGHPADMVIVTSEALPALQQSGKVSQGKPIARVGIGVAVNEKAPNPDIATPQALKRALLAAKSVVYIDPKTGTSGKHVEEMFSKLGILQEMKAKASLGQGGYVTEPVGRGEIELGIHQISEILPVKGVRLAGPLPPELQKYTVYVAAPVLNSQNKPAVDAFIAHLSAPEARARLAASGYTPPE